MDLAREAMIRTNFGEKSDPGGISDRSVRTKLVARPCVSRRPYLRPQRAYEARRAAVWVRAGDIYDFTYSSGSL